MSDDSCSTPRMTMYICTPPSTPRWLEDGFDGLSHAVDEMLLRLQTAHVDLASRGIFEADDHLQQPEPATNIRQFSAAARQRAHRTKNHCDCGYSALMRANSRSSSPAAAVAVLPRRALRRFGCQFGRHVKARRRLNKGMLDGLRAGWTDGAATLWRLPTARMTTLTDRARTRPR